jgi:hypothetical protein
LSEWGSARLPAIFHSSPQSYPNRAPAALLELCGWLGAMAYRAQVANPTLKQVAIVLSVCCVHKVPPVARSGAPGQETVSVSIKQGAYGKLGVDGRGSPSRLSE